MHMCMCVSVYVVIVSVGTLSQEIDKAIYLPLEISLFIIQQLIIK